MLKNKFIRFLVVLNGILLPIYIASFLYMILKDFKRNDNYNKSYVEQHNINKETEKSESEIKITEPRKIFNSDTYFVSIYKKDQNKYNYGSGDVDDVPQNSINIIFLDKDFNVKKKLLKNDGLISNVQIPNRFDRNGNNYKSLKVITYIITEKDTNENGELDNKDLKYLYVSDLNGNSFKKIVKENILNYFFINNAKEIAIKYDIKKPKYGIYNIENSTFKVSKELNSLIDRYVEK